MCIWASVAGVDTKVGVEGVRDRLDIDRVSHDGQIGRWREVANATCRENVRGWGCPGCTEEGPTVKNHCPYCNINSGCQYYNMGCMDASKFNYDSEAEIDEFAILFDRVVHGTYGQKFCLGSHIQGVYNFF